LLGGLFHTFTLWPAETIAFANRAGDSEQEALGGSWKLVYVLEASMEARGWILETGQYRLFL